MINYIYIVERGNVKMLCKVSINQINFYIQKMYMNIEKLQYILQMDGVTESIS